MKHPFDLPLNLKGLGYVALEQLEIGMGIQMGHIACVPGHKIVQGKHPIPRSQEQFGQVGRHKSGPSSDDCCLHYFSAGCRPWSHAPWEGKTIRK